MRILVDTNLPLRLALPSHPLHQIAFDSLAVLRQRGEQLCLVPQNLYEFWVVATRPVAQNGLGLTAAAAQAEVVQLKRLFVLLEDTPAIFPEWERLVMQHQIIGKQAHDARLVAAMNVHDVTQLLTFNASDFQRYSGVVIISPQQLLGVS
jgi:predicted nucleic acid-binding protein